jgi:putative methionine-R-sulfoxide reductase with GAF domain
MHTSPPKKNSNISWRNLNLRTKLITILLVVALIPIIIIAYIADASQRASLTNDANIKLQNAAALISSEIDSFMLDNLNVARAEGQLPIIVDYVTLPAEERAGSPEEERLNSLLLAVSRQNPVYLNSVAILDTDGITVADTNPSAVGTDRSNRYYFQNVMSTNLPYASTIEYDTNTGRASLYIAAPVRTRNGTLIGVYRKRFDSAILQSFVVKQAGLAGEESFAVLIDENFVRIAHGTNRSIVYKSVVPIDPGKLAILQEQRFMPPGSSEELSTNIPGFKAGLDNYKNNPFFTAELSVGGTELEQAAVVKSATQPWLIVFAQPENVFLAPINAQRQTNIIVSLLIALGVAIFGVFISQTISGPIARLTQTAESIAGGDINIQAKVETGDEIGTLAQTFNRMTQQLRDFIASLEERVAARTKDLATVAEVGTATATILETDKLLLAVVNLSKERFNLYHSHIYLLDEKRENLVLAAGAGEPGRQMKAKGLSIPLNREQSLVARAAREQKGVTVNDVTRAPDFLPNPLLPDTRSELAVPMIVGGKVIGVFDVQSDQVGRFTDSDINIQTTLAAQVATSIQNVRSFEQSKAQADLESLVNSIGQKIQRTTTVDDTLQTAIREIGLALGASRVSANIGLRSTPVSNGNEVSDSYPTQ